MDQRKNLEDTPVFVWLIISLKDFYIVIRKWPTFLPSKITLTTCIKTRRHVFCSNPWNTK